jgi:hypothetical protein
VLYRQFGHVVHSYLFPYHWGFTTFPAMAIKSPLLPLASTLLTVLIFVPSTTALALPSTWWTSSSDPSKCVVRSLRKDWEVALADYEKVQDSVPFIGNDTTGCRVDDLWCVCKLNTAIETHVRYEDSCRTPGEASMREAPVGVGACRSACESADKSCEIITVLPAITKPAVGDHHILSPTSSESDLGPLALAKTFQATLVHVMRLGFWKGLMGSLVVFWILVGAIIGCILSIRLRLRRKEGHLRERDRRHELAQAREFGLPARRRSSGRRVRWLDEVGGGHELEKTIDIRCDDLRLDASLPIEKRGVCRACEECLISKID